MPSGVGGVAPRGVPYPIYHPKPPFAAFLEPDIDVGTEAACLDFVNGAAQKFGRLDILINNAGIRKYEKVDEASAASWKEILDVNLMSYRTSREKAEAQACG